MKDNSAKSSQWSFRIIGAVALLWSILGIVNFITQLNADVVAAMPATHRAIIDGRPAWATLGFALAVFGGAVGALLLLLKRKEAFYALLLSLLGVIAATIHALGLDIEFAPYEWLLMIYLPVIVAVFLVWYFKYSERRGWLD